MWDQLRIGLGRALVVLGAALGAYWLAVEGYSLFEQHRLGGLLGSMRGTSRVASPVVVARATRAEANAEGLVGRIEIPRIGVDVVVLDGDDDATLSRGAGHVPHTAYPGERANAAIAGHRDSYFRNLKRIERGDVMKVVTPDGTFSYVVDRALIVGPDRTDLLAAGDSAKLTLVTCYPFHWIGPAPKRFIVQGHWVPQGSSLATDGSDQPSADVVSPDDAAASPGGPDPTPSATSAHPRRREPGASRQRSAAPRPQGARPVTAVEAAPACRTANEDVSGLV